MHRSRWRSALRLSLLPILGLGLSGVACSGKRTERSTASDAATLRFTHRAPTKAIAPGAHDLSAAGIPARLYVPASYRPDSAVPLIILLHGAGASADEWMAPALLPVFEAQRAAILSVQSSGPTWDILTVGFGPDVQRIDTAIAATFARVNVDPSRIALGGFSDGASYALSLGLANGARFKALLAFAPGFAESPARRGKPRVYIAHGTSDEVLPIAISGRAIWGDLQTDGYDVTYREFAGRHRIYLAIVTEALNWFAGLP
jgi:phospholipase/carboxylesterase